MTISDSRLVHRPGAVDAPEGSLDHGVAWHYGDPLGEQRAAAHAAALFDRSNRPVLTIPGEDRLSWLHSICSQHVELLHDGEGGRSLVLSPHGHVEQDWIVTELGGALWLDTEPGQSGEVLGYLQKMRFLKRVEPADVSADWAVLTLIGPAAAQVARAAGLPEPGPAPYAAVALPDGGFVRRMPDLIGPRLDVLAPRDRASRLADLILDAGAAPAGSWAFEALRVEARDPRLHRETDHRTIPHEIDLIGVAVHLDKGCYRGQETIARVQNLGKPPRRMVQLYLSGEQDALPEAGTAVELEGRTVGFLGTAVQHHQLGPIALAVVKRALPDDTVLQIAGSPATIAR